eukprot:TRINITY_DN125592_c0_g1_i1.p1 TRINITY_DN125592_c0_g1~~TRINITY_DN125592_c0_g1_i1.p1  ORF type:complete len:164 (+),score=3.28 TRINITY_DN125592_c0_g1_i1:110-601(+)
MVDGAATIGVDGGISAPEAADVPVPQFLRRVQRRDSPREQIRQLWNEDAATLQRLLSEVATVLTSGRTRSRSTTQLGRHLTLDSQQWLRRHRLNLSKVLRCFPNDFRVSDAFGVSYVRAQVVHSFVLPQRRDEGEDDEENGRDTHDEGHADGGGEETVLRLSL